MASAGWVLARPLVMSIPDEVAQYAEGNRIVSYFSLGDIQDGDQVKHNWLWTTASGSAGAYDFDSFRVFVWSLRRHRYETAYIERNLQGFSPVLLSEVELSAGKGKQAAAAAKSPGFSVCMQKKDGTIARREFAFLTNVVRFAGERPCEPRQPVWSAGSTQPAVSPAAPVAPAQPQSPSLRQRINGAAARLGASLSKLLGR